MALRVPYPCRLFLFDLDGTLVDSKADIALSVNRALARTGYTPLPLSQVIEFVGEGVQRLMNRALREAGGSEPDVDRLRVAVEIYLEEYDKHLLDTTGLYVGVRETLDRLAWARFAVVTNKPENFSRRILEALSLADRFCAILGGDSIIQRKPDPAPLLHAMALCGAAAAETVMVGDSRIDVSAGKAAGVVTCGISGGFRGRAELEAAGCDVIIDTFAELAEHFVAPSPRQSDRQQ